MFTIIVTSTFAFLGIIVLAAGIAMMIFGDDEGVRRG